VAQPGRARVAHRQPGVPQGVVDGLDVLAPQTGQPVGIITEADIAHAVADGKDVNSTRIYEVMNTRPTVINTTASVRDAARVMTSGHFRHLPVVSDVGPVGIRCPALHAAAQIAHCKRS
jgi:CBS domain-containing protein